MRESSYNAAKSDAKKIEHSAIECLRQDSYLLLIVVLLLHYVCHPFQAAVLQSPLPRMAWMHGHA